MPWFRYYDSAAATWVQGYYDDAVSLAAKWDMVNQRGLLGTGMWTLLMDAGPQELWNLLAAKFVNDTTPPTGGITVLRHVTDAYAFSCPGARPIWARGSSSIGPGPDRANGAWTSWLTDTTATSAYWIGQAGHAYEFRVSAVDRNGNRQPGPRARPTRQPAWRWAGLPEWPRTASTCGAGRAPRSRPLISWRSGIG